MGRKWDSLVKQINGLGSVVVAYSGGVDSSLLAYAASRSIGEKSIAITMKSPLELPASLEAAENFVKTYGIRHIVIDYDPLQDPDFVSNPVNRCYYCKLRILQTIWGYASKHGYNHVLDGENADDLLLYRPGHKAKQETGTLSLLAKLGFIKNEIRILSKHLGLSTWNKPSAPCMATRFPYLTRITGEALEKVGRAEEYLHLIGFHEVRVRYYGDMARIEVEQDEIEKAIEQKEKITAFMKEIGFIHVALDLEGYRSGSMDEGLIT